MTIRLRVNPHTKKKDILIDLRSDEDALPHEHEQQHQQLVEKLIEGGLFGEDEIGSIIVERESPRSSATDSKNQPPSQSEPTRQSEQEGR